MEYLPLGFLKRLPPLDKAADEVDPMLWGRIINATSGWNWYLIGAHVLETDAVLFVYEITWGGKLTYLYSSDIHRHALDIGMPNSWDETFLPSRLSVVKQQQQIEARFSLGQVLATPGAIQAFHRNQQNPSDFIKRHIRGDWGNIDQLDTEANEYAVRVGSRILSSYTLNDTTTVWIITEADRSSSTLLLPSEY